MPDLISAHEIKPLFLLSALSDQLSLHPAEGKLLPALDGGGAAAQARHSGKSELKCATPLLITPAAALRRTLLRNGPSFHAEMKSDSAFLP